MEWLTLLAESNYEMYELIKYGYLDKNWDVLSVEEEIGCQTSKSSKRLLSDSTWNLPFQANPHKFKSPLWLFPFPSINLSTRKSSSFPAAAKLLPTCPTLCNPIDGSPPGSAIPGIHPGNTGVGCHFLLQYMKLKSESEVARCLTLSNPMDCSLSGSSLHGTFQARVLESGVIAFSVNAMYILTGTYYFSNHIRLWHEKKIPLYMSRFCFRLPTWQ